MFEVYVLKSQDDDKRYIGSGRDALERLRRHNKGDYRFTKGHRPWKLIYKEIYKTRSEAVKRERFLKTGQGRRLLDRFLSSAAGSSNGRTAAFEAVYPGSKPGPAALERKIIV